jgi:hypothetical protein
MGASRRLGLLFFSLLFVILPSCHAARSLIVDESKTKVELRDQVLRVQLAIENSTAQNIAVRVGVEILDPKGASVGDVTADRRLSRGSNRTPIEVPIPGLKPADIDSVYLYRLRYTISSPPVSGSMFEPVAGIVSVSQIAPEMFDLHLAYPMVVKLGGSLQAIVRAVQPVTSKPIAGVKIQATLDPSDTDSIPLVKASATTDSRGYATVEFVLPEKADADEPTITIKGQRGSYTATLDDEETHTSRFSTFLLNTDKPLYQPGQTLHTRVLAFGPDRRAVANEPLELRVYDPESTLVFREGLKTSKFGIASTDWPIPANERLGTYRLQADFGEGDNDNGGSSTTVKISRYELPTFTVTAKPDKPYYLPDQDAAVDVRADYLFGQPVSHGHVRVVRESDRQWNYREQKWDISEEEAYEGETDSLGRHVTKIDLSKERKDLADNDYERFHDFKYTAYFTDLTSARTEQRSFDLRLTKDPIHIYVISGRIEDRNMVEFYLSTFAADGTPVPCEVAIRTDDAQPPGTGVTQPGQLLRTIRTNRYGVAKISGLVIPKGPGDADEPSLVFHATDANGASGTHTEDFQFYGSPALHVATDKTLYRADDPIEVHLASTYPEATAEVEVLSDSEFISSQTVHFQNGRGTLTFQPNAKFHGPVTIVAYMLGLPRTGRFDETSATGYHTVLFPHDTSLKLDVRMSRATYRPGEEARADFHVSLPTGEAQKGALGLVVVDKAVDERVRTDDDIRRYSGFYAYRSYWEDNGEISGIRRADLDKIDLSKPLPDGFELVAEMLLQQGDSGLETDSTSRNVDLHALFGALIDPPLMPVLATLRMQELQAIPDGRADIQQFLGTTQIANLRDPWGTAYRANIQPNGSNYEVKIESAGPDKKFDTVDDFSVGSSDWPYFTQYSSAIQNALDNYHAGTGGYIRDADTLKTELLKKGLALDSLRDPWGHPYRVEFGVVRTFFTVEVRSAGPDGKFSSDSAPSYDDVVVSRSWIEYFDPTRTKMNAVLDRYYHDASRFPQNKNDLDEAFRMAGIELDSLRDPWGHPYYVTFRNEARYTDAVTVQTYADYQAGQKMTIHPVTSDINFIDIRSPGPDGKEGTPDDFDAAMFSRAVYAEPQEGKTIAAPGQIFSGELGAISGIVTDPTGAVIPNTTVTAKRNGPEDTYQAVSDGDGKYLLRNLKPGMYQVTFTTQGFRDSVFAGVPVSSSVVTQLNDVMQVGAVDQTVEVTAAAVQALTTSSVITAQKVNFTGKSGQGKESVAPLSTPRLRAYFPETLLWQPELVTDSAGAAHLTFPLADSITTWKLRVVASTTDGQIGTAEKDVRAFQPFFADQDLPQFLTVGDEIGLPVLVRNYLDHAEQVNLKLDPQPWLTLLGPATQKAEVAANDSARAIFPMRAETPIKAGKQRVTATAKEAADAIERKTMVRPFGEEKTASASQMFGDSTTLNLSVPENALTSSVEAELKIYPNLMAHVWEAIEAILERPYGCGEQTISSTYPSILLLRYAKQAGRESSPEALRARRYAQLGYDRLLSYADPSGGFTYWGRGDTDLALTAYALMFLHDAKDVIPVDDSLVQHAQTWLLNQTKPDGHWAATDYWSKTEDPGRSAMLTAYIARVLAITKSAPSSNPASKQLAALSDRELASALTWLGPRTQQQDEPYLIASYTLALLDSGSAENRATANKALQRLQSLAHSEGDTTYWSLETNTPFYGWGRAGRLETTALVVEALERGAVAVPGTDPSLVERGTLFLLRNQDRYGIWYSTQATINVLRALALSVSSPTSAKTVNSEAAIIIDGKPATTIPLPPGNELSAPVTADLSKYLGPGDHHVEITRVPGAAKASVQLAETYYVPWNKDAASESTRRAKDSAEALRLAVTYDKTTAKVGEQINCTVKAERVDFRGYGMMLAEIGLPPGAEVDRASLDKAMTASGWDISQYDVLPDRVIVYLWPHAGGTTFSFAFTTRFGINAETVRSTLYDYYNPDAQAVVAPTRLIAQ